MLYRNGNTSFRLVIKSEAGKGGLKNDCKTASGIVISAFSKMKDGETRYLRKSNVFKTLVFISRMLQTDSMYLLSCEKSVRKEENHNCAVIFYHKKCNSTPKL